MKDSDCKVHCWVRDREILPGSPHLLGGPDSLPWAPSLTRRGAPSSALSFFMDDAASGLTPDHGGGPSRPRAMSHEVTIPESRESSSVSVGWTCSPSSHSSSFGSRAAS